MLRYSRKVATFFLMTNTTTPMKILSRPHRKFAKEFHHEFRWKDDPGAGFGFECDKSGTPFLKSEPAKENYESCISGKFDVEDLGVVESERSWFEAAIGKCECGRELQLWDPLNNFCKCGKCFNSSGQEVTPSNECDEWGNPLDDIDPRNWQ